MEVGEEVVMEVEVVMELGEEVVMEVEVTEVLLKENQ